MDKPIVQGGMGVGISLGRLAGAVAKEGGIGMISAAQIGFREPDFDENPREANLRAISKELGKARKIAPRGMIGFNIMVASRYYDEYVKEAVRAGADVIVSGAGLPTSLPEYTAGSDTLIAPIVSTEKSTGVILKYWDRKFQRTADFIVIEGPEAGGHLGFREEQIQQMDYDAEIGRIIAAVRKYEIKYDRKIPVILAGGIDTKERAEHAFALGADGIQPGSVFVTTHECDAPAAFKQCYMDAGQSDIVIVKSPVGMPGRAILNAFMKKVRNGETFPPGRCRQCLQKCRPAEIPYCISERLICAARGETDEALLFCGANAYKADKINTVKAVMDSLLY